MIIQPSQLAYCTHAGAFIEEEIEARGWSTSYVASLICYGDPRQASIEQLALDFMIAVDDPNVVVTHEESARLAKAFGVSADFFYDLQEGYREWAKAQIVRLGTEFDEAKSFLDSRDRHSFQDALLLAEYHNHRILSRLSTESEK